MVYNERTYLVETYYKSGGKNWFVVEADDCEEAEKLASQRIDEAKKYGMVLSGRVVGRFNAKDELEKFEDECLSCGALISGC